MPGLTGGVVMVRHAFSVRNNGKAEAGAGSALSGRQVEALDQGQEPETSRDEPGDGGVCVNYFFSTQRFSSEVGMIRRTG